MCDSGLVMIKSTELAVGTKRELTHPTLALQMVKRQLSDLGECPFKGKYQLGKICYGIVVFF